MLGDIQPWGQDEVRFHARRGWIICRLGKEVQEEKNRLESCLASLPKYPQTRL